MYDALKKCDINLKYSYLFIAKRMYLMTSIN